MAEGNATNAGNQFGTGGAIMIQNLPEGTKVRLQNGAIAEVTANPRDGGWIFVRYLESPKDPSKVGEEDMAFCADVRAVVE